MLLCVDVTHSGCCAQSCGLMWSQWEEILVLQWSSSNGFLLDSLPKWACDLPWASLFWSFCCGTLIIADKWKTLPASNGVICFSALTQKWQQRKRTLCSTEFHYCEANLQDLNPHWLAALHVHASFFLSQLHFLHSNTWILCLYLYSNFCIK